MRTKREKFDSLKAYVDSFDYSRTWTEYFARFIELDANSPYLKPMPAPCPDCAVKCGLYSEISDALRDQPQNVQREISLKWFCHSNRRRACRGNIENIEGNGPNVCARTRSNTGDASHAQDRDSCV